MNKKDIIDKVSKNLSMTKKDAEQVVNEVFDVIVEGVAKEHKVQITDVFNIEARHNKAHVGRNPKTGEPMDIGARWQLYCKFGKGFKDKVNK